MKVGWPDFVAACWEGGLQILEVASRDQARPLNLDSCWVEILEFDVALIDRRILCPICYRDQTFWVGEEGFAQALSLEAYANCVPVHVHDHVHDHALFLFHDDDSFPSQYAHVSLQAWISYF